MVTKIMELLYTIDTNYDVNIFHKIIKNFELEKISKFRDFQKPFYFSPSEVEISRIYQNSFENSENLKFFDEDLSAELCRG